jgi:hypothetical protein
MISLFPWRLPLPSAIQRKLSNKYPTTSPVFGSIVWICSSLKVELWDLSISSLETCRVSLRYCLCLSLI